MNKQKIEAIAVTIDLDKAIVMTQTEIYKFIEELATSIFDKIENVPVGDHLTIKQAMAFLGAKSEEYFKRTLNKKGIPHSNVDGILHFWGKDLDEYVRRNAVKSW